MAFSPFLVCPGTAAPCADPCAAGEPEGGEGPASDEIHCRPAGGVSARVKNSGFSHGLRESFGFLSFSCLPRNSRAVRRPVRRGGARGGRRARLG